MPARAGPILAGVCKYLINEYVLLKRLSLWFLEMTVVVEGEVLS